MRRTIATLLSASLLVGVMALPAAAVPSTLAEQILADADGEFDRDRYDFDIIGEVVKAILDPSNEVTSQLGAAAQVVDGGITAFLPNDRAFQLLAWDLTGKWIRDESKIIPAILSVVDLQTVNTIVEYHVIAGATIDSAAALQADGVSLTSVMGASFTVDVLNQKRALVRLIDNDRNDWDPFLVRSKLDNVASNGIWHGISQVLRPIDVGTKWEWRVR
jgi:uncharacterized surface protein with fasciclin (FAS1) repeats